MQIRGMKHLRKNDYDTVIIKQGQINVYGSSKWPSMRLTHSIEDDLKALNSDDDKKSRIVEYFLDYSKINVVTDNYSQAGNDYLYVGSRSGRSLKFGHQPSADVIRNILEHYQKDRLEFLDSDRDNYEITTTVGTSAYAIDEEGKTKLSICTMNGQIISFENAFLEEYMPILFGDNEVAIKSCYTPSDEGGHRFFDGYFIIGTDKTIKIDLKLIEPLSVIILNHNVSVRDKRQQSDIYKQLEFKMEGF